MRVVGGRLRGRRIAPPEGRDIRPTTDRTRQAMFNVIDSRFRDRLQGGQIADFYAGTGALGIEALSRGAAHATFIERAPAALKLLQENIHGLGLEPLATIHRSDAAEAARRLRPFDMVFMDPPYGGLEAQRTLDALATGNCIKPGGILVLESARADILTVPAFFESTVEKLYGDTRIIFFSISLADITNTK